MTIIAVIAISVFTTLATIALLLWGIKHYWMRRWCGLPGGRSHHHRWRNKRHTRESLVSANDPLQFVEAMLQLDGEQRQLWDSLKNQILENRPSLMAYREVFREAQTVPQLLHRLEDFLGDTGIAVRKLKPAIVEFYQALNVPQQQKINGLLKMAPMGRSRCCHARAAF